MCKRTWAKKGGSYSEESSPLQKKRGGERPTGEKRAITFQRGGKVPLERGKRKGGRGGLEGGRKSAE